MKIPLLYFKIKENINDYLDMLLMIDEFKKDVCKYKLNIKEDNRDYILEIIKHNTLNNKLLNEQYYILLNKNNIGIEMIVKIRAAQNTNQLDYLLTNLVSILKLNYGQYISNIKKSKIHIDENKDNYVYVRILLNLQESIEYKIPRILDKLVIYNNSAYNKILNRHLEMEG